MNKNLSNIFFENGNSRLRGDIFVIFIVFQQAIITLPPTYKEAIMSQFTDRMIRAAKLDVNLYEEVEADGEAMGQAMGVVILSSLAAGIGTATGTAAGRSRCGLDVGHGGAC